MESPSARVTIARLYWGLKPTNLPTRRFLRGGLWVFTLMTLTSKRYSIAALISVLVALGATSKVYLFCSRATVAFSVTIGRRTKSGRLRGSSLCTVHLLYFG